MIAVIFPATNDQSKITRITVARGSSHEANHCAGRYGDVRDRRLCGHRIGDSQCRLTEVFIDPPPRGLDWCAHDATVCRPGSGPRLRSNRSTPLKAPLQVVVSGDALPGLIWRGMQRIIPLLHARLMDRCVRRSLEAQLAWMHRVHPQRRTRQARPAPYLNHKGGRR